MKKVAIMQPYFFPYLGYFSLIKHVNEFILLDTVQYIRHGWIERNRVLKQNEDWLYIKVPLLKHSQKDAIKNIKIDNSKDWKAKIVSQLEIYKKPAPQYIQVRKLVDEIFEQNFTDIVSLNEASLKAICDYLGISTKINIFSKMNLLIEKPSAPDEWALNICKALGDVSEYINPQGGKEFFDVEKYRRANIEVKFQNLNLGKYDQKRDPFEPGMSIIDVMMFNSPDKINTMLDEFELV